MHNRDVLRKCEQEIDEKLQGRVPTHADIKSLGSVQRVLKETLRLNPPVAFVARTDAQKEPGQTIMANGKYRFERGQRFLLNIYGVQRDPAVWERPDEFAPDIHLAEGRVQAPDSFKAFGTGMRACIGSIFALDEAALALTDPAAVRIAARRALSTAHHQHADAQTDWIPVAFQAQERAQDRPLDAGDRTGCCGDRVDRVGACCGC